MTVGERLQNYRKQHNLSQEELAKQLFVTRQTISLWETDQTLPTIDNLVRLKDILEVSIDDILTGPAEKDEEENQPLESYEFKYSKPIFKSVFKTVNIKSFLTHLVLTLLLILNTVRTYFIVTDDISKGLYWGFAIIAVIFFIRYIIGIAKAWNINKIQVLKNEYKYDVFDSFLRITVINGDEIIAVRTITPESVTRCWSTKDLYIFEHQKAIYCMKKHSLDSNSRLHFFFYKGKEFKQKNTNALSIAANIFFVLSFLTIFAGIIFTSAMSASNNLYYENMWVFFIFLPIPIVSIILGALRLKRREKGRKNIIVGIIMAFLLIIYGSFSIIHEEPKTVVRPTVDVEIDSEEVTVVYDYISEIEKTVNIDLPDSGVITDTKTVVGGEPWNEDISYNITTMKISNHDAHLFEKDQTKFDLWNNRLSSEFDDYLPHGIKEFDADYHLIYNETNDEYNKLITVDGEYKLWYLCYYADENCFKAVNYTIKYRTEHKDPYFSIEYQTNWWSDENLSNVGLEGCTVAGVLYGNINSTEEKSEVHLLKDDRYNSVYHDLYLAVETDKWVYFYDFADSDVNYSGALFEDWYLADLDGDGLDEIIVNRCIAMSGGAGGYISQVFKYYGYADFRMIFNSANTFEYYTGFTSELKDDFKLEISNVFTGYKTIVDYSEIVGYRGVYWDDSGKVIAEKNIDHLMYDGFLEFSPKDVDNDGIDELVCLQYTSLYGHSDYIGNVKSVLKYNAKYKTFEVIDAEFIPYEE